MNTIRIELCQEDRDRLDKILEALTTNVAGYVIGQYDRCLAEKEQPTAPAPVNAEPVIEPQATEDTAPVEEPAEAKETAAAEPEPTVSQAGVQKKVVELSAAGKKDAVKQIVQAYAPRVSAIPEDKLAEVWQKLTALEG